MGAAKVLTFLLLTWTANNGSAKPFPAEVDHEDSSTKDEGVEGEPLPVQPVKSTEGILKEMKGRHLQDKDGDLGCAVDLEADAKERANALLGRNAVLEDKYLWKKSFNVYLDPKAKFNAEDREDIGLMLGRLQDVFGDCLKIGLYPPGVTPKGSNYATVIKNRKQSCRSDIGRRGRGTQYVNLPEGCLSYNSIIHELMHALGLAHEQARSDRDNYITVNWENIETAHKFNFNKVDSRLYGNYGVDYDYNSLMHYRGTVFSKNGQDTMVAKDNPRQLLGPNHRDGRVPESDRLKLRRMYKCGD